MAEEKILWSHSSCLQMTCVPNCLLRAATHQWVRWAPGGNSLLDVPLDVQQKISSKHKATRDYINAQLPKNHICKYYCLNIIRKGEAKAELDESRQIYLGFTAHCLPDDHRSAYIMHLKHLCIYSCVSLSVFYNLAHWQKASLCNVWSPDQPHQYFPTALERATLWSPQPS